MREHCRQLDISVEISGPHDFAVRDDADRQSRASHPSHPAPNVRDDRETPLLIRHRTREEEPLICPTAQAHIFASRLNDQISSSGFD
jgi:hypothetical protein